MAASDVSSVQDKMEKSLRCHQVIHGEVIEGEIFIKSQNPQCYRPCNRHKYQMMDMFCRTCTLPICRSCCNSGHQGHACCGLIEQAEMCKIQLHEVCENTNGLLIVLTNTIDETMHQVQQANADITKAFDHVKSTLKTQHGEFKDVNKILLLQDLENVHMCVKKTTDLIIEQLMMTLGRLEALKSNQVNLADTGSLYDYVRATESIRRDVEDHCGRQLPRFMWSCQFVTKNRAGDGCPSGRVELIQTEEKFGDRMGKAGRIDLNYDKDPVNGMVVHKDHIYAVHTRRLIVYCFNDEGDLITEYTHGDLKATSISDMCLMMDGDTAMLVVSNSWGPSLIWLMINDDLSMTHHYTRYVGYSPCSLHNDRGTLIVCDYGQKIHRYTFDGNPLEVITLHEESMPWSVTGANDGQHYFIGSCVVAAIDRRGNVMGYYQDHIHGIKLHTRSDILVDAKGRILISDDNQVLLLSNRGDKVCRLLKEYETKSSCLHLDHDKDRLYVSGKDWYDVNHVSIYDYSKLTGDNPFVDMITKLELILEMWMMCFWRCIIQINK